MLLANPNPITLKLGTRPEVVPFFFYVFGFNHLLGRLTHWISTKEGLEFVFEVSKVAPTL